MGIKPPFIVQAKDSSGGGGGGRGRGGRSGGGGGRGGCGDGDGRRVPAPAGKLQEALKSVVMTPELLTEYGSPEVWAEPEPVEFDFGDAV